MAQIAPTLVTNPDTHGHRGAGQDSAMALRLNAPNMPELVVPLQNGIKIAAATVGHPQLATSPLNNPTTQVSLCAPSAQLCGKRYVVRRLPDPGDKSSAWLTMLLSSDGLVRNTDKRVHKSPQRQQSEQQQPRIGRYCIVEMLHRVKSSGDKSADSKQNFANDGAYLLVSQSNINALNQKLRETHAEEIAQKTSKVLKRQNKRKRKPGITYATPAQVTSASFR